MDLSEHKPTTITAIIRFDRIINLDVLFTFLKVSFLDPNLVKWRKSKPLYPSFETLPKGFICLQYRKQNRGISRPIRVDNYFSRSILFDYVGETQRINGKINYSSLQISGAKNRTSVVEIGNVVVDQVNQLGRFILERQRGIMNPDFEDRIIDCFPRDSKEFTLIFDWVVGISWLIKPFDEILIASDKISIISTELSMINYYVQIPPISKSSLQSCLTSEFVVSPASSSSGNSLKIVVRQGDRKVSLIVYYRTGKTMLSSNNYDLMNEVYSKFCRLTKEGSLKIF